MAKISSLEQAKKIFTQRDYELLLQRLDVLETELRNQENQPTFQPSAAEQASLEARIKVLNLHL